ncbi:uncharacterized protein LOC143152577 [Ptiloglossa arizonensis]|uniref:uncharacterized protein LOC143152577 n=1 Tax=Ptiloglossa arizonensis TaxID=3350558 RepID=UPI003F9FEBE8
MNITVATILSVVYVLLVARELQCARILAIIPTPSYSHQIPYRSLWLQLNKRGHEIVLVTPNPIPNLSLTNFTQINIGASYSNAKKFNHISNRFNGIRWIQFLQEALLTVCDDFAHIVLNHTYIKKLYAPDSNEKFDLILMEILLTPSLYALAHRFDAPFIGLSSLSITAYNEHILGGLVMPSHESTWEMEACTGPHLSFKERVTNFVSLWRYMYHIYYDFIPRQQKIAESYLGSPLPSINDILKNMSLLFVNQADAIVPARPKLANMITFTSSHILENPTPLPQDLKYFLDNATEGFIYFSLGSNAMSSDMPIETIQVFLDVFAKLPYKVVWKFEKNYLNKTDNVFIGPWFTQQSILAHPNIKLFIYQGGLQSSEEAIHFGVPLLGLPVLADQDYQVNRMKVLGVGEVLELTTLNRDELESTIWQLTTNKEYKRKMIKLKEIVNDNPHDLVDNLVWWAEYVIRHKGAPHFRSNLADIPWYQRTYDLDIVVFFTTVACITIFVLYESLVKPMGKEFQSLRAYRPAKNYKQKERIESITNYQKMYKSQERRPNQYEKSNEIAFYYLFSSDDETFLCACVSHQRFRNYGPRCLKTVVSNHHFRQVSFHCLADCNDRVRSGMVISCLSVPCYSDLDCQVPLDAKFRLPSLLREKLKNKVERFKCITSQITDVLSCNRRYTFVNFNNVAQHCSMIHINMHQTIKNRTYQEKKFRIKTNLRLLNTTRTDIAPAICGSINILELSPIPITFIDCEAINLANRPTNHGVSKSHAHGVVSSTLYPVRVQPTSFNFDTNFSLRKVRASVSERRLGEAKTSCLLVTGELTEKVQWVHFAIKSTGRLATVVARDKHRDSANDCSVVPWPARTTDQPRGRTTMKFTVALVFSVACILCVVDQLQSARILAMVPTASYSHQIPYRPLWIELNKRGHDVVLVTADPIPNLNLTNFVQIDVGGSYKVIRRIDFIRYRFEGISWINFLLRDMLPIANNFVEQVFNNTELKKLYAPDSGVKFDVVLSEVLYMPGICAIAHRFKAPFIGLSSLGLVALNEHILGGIVLPSHEYTWEMEANTGPDVSFWRRVKNFVTLWHSLHYTYTTLLTQQQELAEKYFGPDLPSVLDILKNTSLMFVNQADSIAPARPKLANMITFSSSHIDENPKPLPQDLKRFLDTASNGFIYFSLGSNAMSSDLPEDILQVFIDVFTKLPYRIVWKFETELAKKPDNVFISPWLSQQSILAHPNIKLFIYQGGLQSSEEAIHFTVPLLGLPVLADQDYQVNRMKALGVARVLEITNVKRDELESAIHELINNEDYKKNIIKLKNRVNDYPYDSVKNLAWWTEYVIRHDGAPHLRSSLAWQPWYRRYDWDIIVFLTIVACIVVFVAFRIITKMIALFLDQGEAYPGFKKQKVS